MRNHKIRQKIIRLRPRNNSKYILYDIIVTFKDRRKKSFALDKIGIYNPNFGNKWIMLNSYKLAKWLTKGIIIKKIVKKKISKCLSIYE